MKKVARIVLKIVAITSVILSFSTCKNVLTSGLSLSENDKQNMGGGYTDFNELIVEKRENCVNGHWNADNVELRNPVDLKILTNGKFNIRSFCMFDLDSVKVVADLGGKKIVLADVPVKPFDDNDFKIKLFEEDGFYLVDGKNIFVSKNDYSNLKNIRLEINDERYKKIQNIDVCWRMNFITSLGDAPCVANQQTVKSSIMAHTNIAYALASKEFDQIVRHYQEIVGHPIVKYEEYEGANTSDKPNIATLRKKPYTECAWKLDTEDDFKEFFSVLGVRSGKFSALQTRNTFSWGLQDNPLGLGRDGVTTLDRTYTTNTLTGGFRYVMRTGTFYSDAENSMDIVSIHELGHLFGYAHYSEFSIGTMADKGPMTIAALTDLMQVSGRAPYGKAEMKSYTGVSRCGFNKIEKFIYDHRNDYFKDSDLPAYMDKVKNERNAGYDRVVTWMNKNAPQNPPGIDLRGAWLKAYNTQEQIRQIIHRRDRDIYGESPDKEIKNVFYKLP